MRGMIRRWLWRGVAARRCARWVETYNRYLTDTQPGEDKNAWGVLAKVREAEWMDAERRAHGQE
jgi:hypothetical protein